MSAKQQFIDGVRNCAMEKDLENKTEFADMIVKNSMDYCKKVDISNNPLNKAIDFVNGEYDMFSSFMSNVNPM